jgi:ankyrin repeat protein
MSKLYCRAFFLAAVLFFPLTLSADADEQLKAIDKSIRLREYGQAVKLLQPLLRSSNAEAQFRMATIYRSGTGIKRDLGKAMALYEKAAARGHVDAQYTFASLLYKRGETSAARRWFQQASSQGHLKAQKKLASMQQRHDSDDHADIKPDEVFSSILHNDIERIKVLVEDGFNFAIHDAKSRTPLMAALLSEHKEIATLLLPVTHKLSHADSNKVQAIHLAAANGYRAMVNQLLKKGVDVDAQDALGNTALIIAVRRDNARLIRLLLDRKASYRVKNNNKNSALNLALARRNGAVLKVFSQKGIDVTSNTTDVARVDINSFRKSIKQAGSLYSGWPMLSIASLLGEKDIVDQLVKQGEDVNARDKSGYTALHRASSKGQLETMKVLHASGADVNAVSERNETSLFLAAQSGRLEVVKWLLQQDADSAVVTSSKVSALAEAISNGHPAVGEVLVGKNLDKESLHEALLLSVQHNHQQLSLKLIPWDRLLNKLDSNQRSVLWHSANLGQERVSAALVLTKAVNIDQKDINGYSPLARAALKGHRNIAAIMMSKGGDVNARTGEKNTLLMLSVVSGNKALVELFSDKGIDINAKNNVGDTALMLAAAAGNNEMIEILIKAGADLQSRNQDELNAYQIALNSGHKETAELIRKRSGRLFKLFN